MEHGTFLPRPLHLPQQPVQACVLFSSLRRGIHKKDWQHAARSAFQPDAICPLAVIGPSGIKPAWCAAAAAAAAAALGPSQGSRNDKCSAVFTVGNTCSNKAILQRICRLPFETMSAHANGWYQSWASAPKAALCSKVISVVLTLKLQTPTQCHVLCMTMKDPPLPPPKNKKKKHALNSHGSYLGIRTGTPF